jgi:phosphoenolpyruvate carboxylase
MNYGLVSAVLLNKIALFKLYRLSQDSGVKIYPIVGAGSAPFRGNLTPLNAERVSSEYPSAYTFTIQSAFKFDYPPQQVREAVKILKERKPSPPHPVDEKRCMKVIEKYAKAYQAQILSLASMINKVSPHIPSRRKRKLHVGLFGYSREVGGIRLPRAIRFTASLYSIGLPPEVLGMNALEKEDIEFIKGIYINFEDDIRDASRYLNPQSPFIPQSLKECVKEILKDTDISKDHKEATDAVISSLVDKKDDPFTPLMEAAKLRGFLG